MGASNIMEDNRVYKDFEVTFFSQTDISGGFPRLDSRFFLFYDESLYAVFPVSALDNYVTENNGNPIKARVYSRPDARYCGCTLLRPVFSDTSDMLVGFIKLCDFTEE